MTASLEIGRDEQSPRISHTFDFSQAETERNSNDWESPRISFSVYVSQTDWISPEKRKRDDVADIDCGTDFEFCANGRNSIISETHHVITDELFVDGKMLPLIHGRVEAQPVTIAHLVSLESLRCLSPFQLTSSPSSKIRSSCWGNVASKSLGDKPPNKWKEMLFKLRKKENVCAENKLTSCKLIDQSQSSSTNSVWSFSRSCRRGGEMKGNSLFRSLPFSRNQSTAERKLKGATCGCISKEIEIDVSGVVEGSKHLEGWNICNRVQPEPECFTELKPRCKADKANGEANGKQYSDGRGKLSSSGLPASGMRRGMGGQRCSGRVSGNGRLMAGNLDSPPPGKPMAEGTLAVKANNSMGGVRVRPVLNVGGSWNGGGGLFGFFSKRERKQPQSCAYRQYHPEEGTSSAYHLG